ncbi:MAG: hypothetical protein ACLFP4_12670 [Spirochaetales bacterium]
MHSEKCVALLLQVNPCLEIEEPGLAGLTEIYLSSYAMIRSGAPVESVIHAQHLQRLKARVAALYPEGLRQSLRSSPQVGMLAYSQYSVEFSYVFSESSPTPSRVRCST